MGWLKQLERPYSHDCVLPSPYARAPGSVWQCDDCLKKWVIVARVGLSRRYDDFEWEYVPPAEELPEPPEGPSGTQLRPGVAP